MSLWIASGDTDMYQLSKFSLLDPHIKNVVISLFILVYN